MHEDVKIYTHYTPVFRDKGFETMKAKLRKRI